MSGEPAEKSVPQSRLDSWKSIALYFDRSCRTVQRWHNKFGLPIRHFGGPKSSVFAYAEELDEWIRNHSLDPMDDPAEDGDTVLLPFPAARPQLVPGNKALDPASIHDSAKARSAEQVAFAYKLWDSISQNNLRLIAQHFRMAIDLDPGNAAAFAGLSLTMIVDGLWGLVYAPVAYTSARHALQRALEIDSGLPEAKYAEAWLKMVSTRDWQGAHRGFDEAFKQPLRTRDVRIGWALLHVAEGCPREASVLLREAALQNPLRSNAISLYCWSEYLAGEFANALLEIEQYRASGRSGPVVDAVEALASIQLEEPDAYLQRMEAMAADSPKNDVLRGALGYVYGVTGQNRKAHQLLDTMTNPRTRGMSREPYAVALILIGLKERQEAMKWLEQSYRDGSLWSLGFLSDPILASLRNDPLHRQFLSKVSYPVSENSAPLLAIAL